MKNKWVLSVLLLFVFVAIIIVSNSISNSINNNVGRDFTYISLLRDEHVVPFEKVYIELDGNKEHMTNMDMILGNERYSFKVNILDLQSDKPYFETPIYGKNVVVGNKYFIKEFTIKYDDGEIIRYTTNETGNNHVDIDNNNSYFVIEEVNDDADAWRDFRGIDFSNSVLSNENIYFKIYGNTKEMVDIELEWVRFDENRSFLTNVGGLGNRPFMDISESGVQAGEEYYLKSMTIFYNNGGTYTFCLVSFLIICLPSILLPFSS